MTRTSSGLINRMEEKIVKKRNKLRISARSFWLIIWLGSRANSWCSSDVLSLRTIDPTSCSIHPTSFLPAESLSRQRLQSFDRTSHRFLGQGKRQLRDLRSRSLSVSPFAACAKIEWNKIQFDLLKFTLITFVPRLVSGCLAWYMQKYLRCPFNARTVPIQFLGLIWRSRDSVIDRRNSSEYQLKPFSVSMIENISVLFLFQRIKLLCCWKSYQMWILLSIRPNRLVKTREQLWSRLLIGNQNNGSASWFQQTNQSIVFLCSQLMDLQFRHVYWIICRHFDLRLWIISLLSDVFLFDFHQICHEISNAQNKQHRADNRDDWENVFFAQAVVKIVDTNNDAFNDTCCEVLWMLVEQVLKQDKTKSNSQCLMFECAFCQQAHHRSCGSVV